MTSIDKIAHDKHEIANDNQLSMYVYELAYDNHR